MKRHLVFNLALCVTLAAGCGSRRTDPNVSSRRVIPGPGITPLKAGEALPEAAGRTGYVPVYLFAWTQDAPREFKLTAAVYVRDTDRAAALYVRSAAYHDSGGKLLREYFPVPIKAGAPATLKFFVPESNVSGGLSASMIVEWSAEKTVSPPMADVS